MAHAFGQTPNLAALGTDATAASSSVGCPGWLWAGSRRSASRRAASKPLGVPPSSAWRDRLRRSATDGSDPVADFSQVLGFHGRVGGPSDERLRAVKQRGQDLAAEIDRLRRDARESARELETVWRQLEATRGELTDAHGLVGRYQAEAEVRRGEVEMLREELAAAEAEKEAGLAASLKQYKELEEALDLAHSELMARSGGAKPLEGDEEDEEDEEVDVRLKAAEAARADAASKMEAMRKACEGKTEELERMRTAAVEAEAKVAEAEVARAAATAELEETRARVSSLQARCSELVAGDGKRVRGLRQKMGAMEAEIERQAAVVRRKTDAVAELRARNGKLRAELATAKDAADEAATKAVELEEKVAERNAAVEETKAKLEEIREEVGKRNAALRESAVALEEVSGREKKALESIAALEDAVKMRQAELELQTTRREDLEAELAELKSRAANTDQLNGGEDKVVTITLDEMRPVEVDEQSSGGVDNMTEKREKELVARIAELEGALEEQSVTLTGATDRANILQQEVTFLEGEVQRLRNGGVTEVFQSSIAAIPNGAIEPVQKESSDNASDVFAHTSSQYNGSNENVRKVESRAQQGYHRMSNRFESAALEDERIAEMLKCMKQMEEENKRLRVTALKKGHALSQSKRFIEQYLKRSTTALGGTDIPAQIENKLVPSQVEQD